MAQQTAEIIKKSINDQNEISTDSVQWQIFKKNYVEMEKQQIENACWVAYKEGRIVVTEQQKNIIMKYLKNDI